MSKSCLVLLTIFSASHFTVFAQVDVRMLRQPDVCQTHIAFVYAGDIWVVPKKGGTAERLSSPQGEESLPRFSPDGNHLAFNANYDGSTDIYVIPTSGGLPTRVTYHPGSDRMLDWYPDGQSILLASGMESGRQRFNQFFKVSREGGLPTQAAGSVRRVRRHFSGWEMACLHTQKPRLPNLEKIPGRHGLRHLAVQSRRLLRHQHLG